MKIFCISIFNKHYDEFKKLNLVPVGLGNANFDRNWLNDKKGKNISKKKYKFWRVYLSL